MLGTIDFLGELYPVTHTELYLPMRKSGRWIYLTVYGGPGGFIFCQVELPLLEDIDKLDGQRIHVKGNGEPFEDDTLATDAVGMDDSTDLNYWNMLGEPVGRNFCYGEIRIDFKRVEGRNYECDVMCRLTDVRDGKPTPENCPIVGRARFEVTVSEDDPW